MSLYRTLKRRRTTVTLSWRYIKSEENWNTYIRGIKLDLVIQHDVPQQLLSTDCFSFLHRIRPITSGLRLPNWTINYLFLKIQIQFPKIATLYSYSTIRHYNRIRKLKDLEIIKIVTPMNSSSISGFSLGLSDKFPANETERGRRRGE